MKKTVMAVVALVASLGLTLSACGTSSGDDSSSNVITAYNTEPQSGLIPGDTNETGGGNVVRMLFAGLISYTHGDVKNEVAESITPNDDASVYTIKLKPNWKFTDGTPVTSESFTKAWSYTANAKNAQKNSSYLSEIKGYDELQDADNLDGTEQLSGLNIVDDSTFTVTLTQPDSVFPVEIGDSSFFPLPDSFYDDPTAFGQNPVGNGPYKFVSWDHDSQITLTKNPDYNGNDIAQNDGLVFKIYTSTDAAYADVQAGNLDVMGTVPTSATKTFETDSSVQAYNKAGSLFQSFTIPSTLKHWEPNTQEGKLRRQALSMAIDRDAICSKVLNGVATPAVDFIAPVISGYSDDLKGSSVLKYDADKAKELWAQAESISHYDGGLVFTYDTSSGAQPVFDAIVNSINNVLNIGAVTNPIATHQELRTAITDRKIDGAFRTIWQADYPSASNYLYQLYDSNAADGKGSNDGDYKNTQVDELLSKALASTNTDQQNSYYHQAEEILLEQLPAIPLYYSNAVGVAALGIKGFTMNWQNKPIYTELTKA